MIVAAIVYTVFALLLWAFAGLVKRGKDAHLPAFGGVVACWSTVVVAEYGSTFGATCCAIVAALLGVALSLVAFGTKAGPR